MIICGNGKICIKGDMPQVISELAFILKILSNPETEIDVKITDARSSLIKMDLINKILESMSPVYDDENPDCFLG